MTCGGIEAGVTKRVCGIGSGPDDLRQTVSFPTTMPDETIGRARRFFLTNGEVKAIGVGSFGPIDVPRSSPTWGHITTTPKPGRSNTDVARPCSMGSTCLSRSTPTSMPPRSPSGAGAPRSASTRLLGQRTTSGQLAI
jgi:hypothetical protein